MEGIVSKIARSAYTRDVEVLARHASPDLRDHYGNLRGFQDHVDANFRSAPEVTTSKASGEAGAAKVIDAAPANLFDEAVIYRVVLEDARGDEHVLGMVLTEAPEDAASEIVYCLPLR